MSFLVAVVVVVAGVAVVMDVVGHGMHPYHCCCLFCGWFCCAVGIASVRKMSDMEKIKHTEGLMQ